MFREKAKTEPVTINEMKGGKKYVLKYSYIGDQNEYFTPYADVVSKLVLVPGASIGYHSHVGNEETIVVLSGRAKCTDDGEVYEMAPCDATICRENHFHSIENLSETEDLEVMAIVIKTPQA